LAMPDHDFAEEDLAKSRNAEAMSEGLDARASRVHFLDARTKNRSVRLDLIQGRAVFKRFLRYFAEFSLFSKLILCVFKGPHSLKKLHIEIHMHGTSRDAQVLKFGADQEDVALARVREMLRIQARNDAVGGDDVQDVETFDRGGNQRVMAAIIGLMGAGNVCVAFAEGNKLAKLKILDARTPVPAADGKRTRSLYIDVRAERASKAAAERMGAGMVMKCAGRFGAHRVTF